MGALHRITCMLGRGRGRVPAHDLRSSSRARLSISNCLSCSRTEASREAVLAHCSIHTLRVEQRTGQGRIKHQRAENLPLGDRQPKELIRNPEPIQRLALTLMCLESQHRMNLREKDGERTRSA